MNPRIKQFFKIFRLWQEHLEVGLSEVVVSSFRIMGIILLLFTLWVLHLMAVHGHESPLIPWLASISTVSIMLGTAFFGIGEGLAHVRRQKPLSEGVLERKS